MHGLNVLPLPVGVRWRGCDPLESNRVPIRRFHVLALGPPRSVGAPLAPRRRTRSQYPPGGSRIRRRKHLFAIIRSETPSRFESSVSGIDQVDQFVVGRPYDLRRIRSRRHAAPTTGRCLPTDPRPASARTLRLLAPPSGKRRGLAVTIRTEVPQVLHLQSSPTPFRWSSWRTSGSPQCSPMLPHFSQTYGRSPRARIFSDSFALWTRLPTQNTSSSLSVPRRFGGQP